MTALRVIDADGHVNEPEDLWAERLPSRYHRMAPRRVLDSQGRVRLFIAEELQPFLPSLTMEQAQRPGGVDPKARLVDMDAEGLDVAVCFTSIGLYFGGVADADLNAALCRAYNDWLYDYTQAAPDRLAGVAMVPQLDVGLAMEEAERAVRDLGFKAVMWRPNPIAGRDLDHPALAPFLSLMEELGAALAIHEGTSQNLPQAGLDRFDNYLYRHMVSHPHEQQMACMTLICGGTLERHPRLKVVFLESGAGWIAHWLERMDDHIKHWGYTSGPLALKPSEYYQRQCFISADPDEAIIPGLVQALGDDTIVFATDYPHSDSIFPGVVAALRDRADLSEESKAKILGENAARLYGL